MTRIRFAGARDPDLKYEALSVAHEASPAPAPVPRPEPCRWVTGKWPATPERLVLLPTPADLGDYRGGLRDGLPHGLGQLTTAAGASYEGQWEAGLPHGRGTLRLPRRAVPEARAVYTYEGTFWRGEAHGTGSVTLTHGPRTESVTRGDFWHGFAHGVGAEFSADGGLAYRGDLRHGRRHGQGCANQADGSGYHGDFVDGRAQGRGALVLPGGARWEGEVRMGMPSGVGVMRLPHGRVFEGVWRGGAKEGAGVLHSRGGIARLPTGLHLYRDGRLALLVGDADTADALLLPLAQPSAAAAGLAAAWVAAARRGQQDAFSLEIEKGGDIGLQVGAARLDFLGHGEARKDAGLTAWLRGLALPDLLAQKAAAGSTPAAAAWLKTFKLAAWTPNTRLLGALEAVGRRLAAAGPDGSPAAANLVRALTMLQGPALCFATKSPGGATLSYPCMEAYNTQVELVGNLLLEAPHYTEIVLDKGDGPRPPTTLLFHGENYAEQGPALRGLVGSLCEGFALAHAADATWGKDGSMPMVDALLGRINDRGPCLDGRVSAMQESLVDLGLVVDDAELVPDLAGKDDLAQCSEHVRVFQLQQLRAFAAARGVPPVKHLVLEHPDFAAQYFTEARFVAYFRATPAGAALSAARLTAAVRHQVDVLGLL